ncbi:MAG: Gfo/Idh/MocA family oxidoreductase, partial [Hungatella sp.]
MIRFAVIGTNSISDTFMDAAREVAGFSLGAVYSRTLEHGQAFADRYGARCVYTSLEELAAASDIDAVYIASPNSCHCKQTIQMLEGKKHVLCEKPIASDLEELRQMLEAAKRNHVVLLEAMRSVFDPGFAKLQELLPRLGTLRHVAFQYCQYSSRYDKFKEGMVMNAFNPLLSNAALMDIGVYCVHPMVKLFGMPQKI